MYANRDNLLPPWVDVILRANKQSQSWGMMATRQGYTGHYLHLFEDTNSISLNMRLFRSLFSIFCHMHGCFSKLWFFWLTVFLSMKLEERKKDWISKNSEMKVLLRLSSRDDLLLAHVKHFWMKSSRNCEKVTFSTLTLPRFMVLTKANSIILECSEKLDSNP